MIPAPGDLTPLSRFFGHMCTYGREHRQTQTGTHTHRQTDRQIDRQREFPVSIVSYTQPVHSGTGRMLVSMIVPPPQTEFAETTGGFPDTLPSNSGGHGWTLPGLTHSGAHTDN